MRLFSFLLACFALIAGAVLAVPASAQQPAVPSPITSSPVSELTPLVIPPPPGGKLRVEMDARSEDLLGMVKSFLKGIGETGTPTVLLPGQTAASASAPNPIAQAIASGDLAAMLKDVNHVHVVVYEISAPTASRMAVTLGNPAVPKSPLAAPIFAAPLPAVPAFDSNSFYENAFASEGAHRILYTDADAYKLVMVGFPNGHGFAFAASGGGYLVVERSDGYPDLEVLSAFISRVSTAVLNSETAKKAMKSALDSDKASVPEAKAFGRK